MVGTAICFHKVKLRIVDLFKYSPGCSTGDVDMVSDESCPTGDVDVRCPSQGHGFELPLEEIAGVAFRCRFWKASPSIIIEAT